MENKANAEKIVVLTDDNEDKNIEIERLLGL